MRNLGLVLTLVFATGIAVIATVVQATVAAPPKTGYTVCTPSAAALEDAERFSSERR